MKIIGIYKLTSPSGKCYVGQSTNIDQRFRQHKRDKRYKHPKLFNAIKKYGYDTFTREIVETCSFNELDDREKHWIKHYNSVDNGYNCDYGGQQSKIFSPEHRRKLHDAFLGVYNGDQNIKFFIDGVLYTSIGNASKILNVPPKTIHNRLNSTNEIYSSYKYKNNSLTPIRVKRRYASKPFKIGKDIYTSLRRASNALNIPPVTLMRKLKNGQIPGATYLD